MKAIFSFIFWLMLLGSGLLLLLLTIVFANKFYLAQLPEELLGNILKYTNLSKKELLDSLFGIEIIGFLWIMYYSDVLKSKSETLDSHLIQSSKCHHERETLHSADAVH